MRCQLTLEAEAGWKIFNLFKEKKKKILSFFLFFFEKKKDPHFLRL